jgi:hypothetical protein
MKLWTVWLDYGGTGEGSTFAARVAYADDEQGALAGFEKVFGDFDARCAYAVEGVAENRVTRSLFAPEMSTALLRSKVAQTSTSLPSTTSMPRESGVPPHKRND